MSARIAHHVTDDGVLVVLRPEIGAPTSLRVTPGEAKRHAWALLADLGEDTEEPVDEITVGPIRIEPEAVRVSVDGHLIHLSRSLYVLLCRLAATPGRPVSKDALMDALYGDRDQPACKILDVMICKLRAALDQHGAGGHIVTAWGMGYSLSPEAVWAPSGPRRRRPSIKWAVLQRLRRGAADIAALRKIDPDMSLFSLRAVLARLVREGRVRNVGGRRAAMYELVAKADAA